MMLLGVDYHPSFQTINALSVEVIHLASRFEEMAPGGSAIRKL